LTGRLFSSKDASSHRRSWCGLQLICSYERGDDLTYEEKVAEGKLHTKLQAALDQCKIEEEENPEDKEIFDDEIDKE
jgi:hypothetical protein